MTVNVSPVHTPPLRCSPSPGPLTVGVKSSFIVSDTRRMPRRSTLASSKTTSSSSSGLLCLNSSLEDEMMNPSAVPEWLPQPPHAAEPNPVTHTAGSNSTNNNTSSIINFGPHNPVAAGSPVSILRRRSSCGSNGSYSSAGSPRANLLRRGTASSSTSAYGLSVSLPLLTPRTDIDMKKQKKLQEERRKENLRAWVVKSHPSRVALEDIVWMLKALVVEAEHYQTQRGWDLLKRAVVGRAVAALGGHGSCPPGYYERTTASSILFNDIDCVMALPPESIPEGGAIAFAVREVQTFPLWLPTKGTQIRTDSPTSPVSPTPNRKKGPGKRRF